MYTAPDFVKVAVKVEESFAKYSCTEIIGNQLLLNACDSGIYQSFVEIYPDSPFLCFSGENE